jgi:hypothetical protein
LDNGKIFRVSVIPSKLCASSVAGMIKIAMGPRLFWAQNHHCSNWLCNFYLPVQ